MIKLTNWAGLCLLIFSLQVHGGEITIQDAWISPMSPGQEEAIVGMVISSAKAARIVAVISPAYMNISMKGPGKGGTNKTQELGFIDLPAKNPVLLGVDGIHLFLSGNKQTIRTNDKIPVIITVEFEDKTSKTFKILTTPAGSNVAVAAPAPVIPAPTAPRHNIESASKDEEKTVTPPASSKARTSPAEVSSPAKPVATSKPPATEEKRAKTAPPAEPKPAPVAARVIPAPLATAPQAAAPIVPQPTPVVTTPAVAPTPTVAAPSVVAPSVEPKKAPIVKPIEQSKPVDAGPSAQCLKLAEEMRNCDPSNDTVLEWCESSAKARHPCSLTMEQLKKLKN
jgi:copper(I)-binding protein